MLEALVIIFPYILLLITRTAPGEDARTPNAWDMVSMLIVVTIISSLGNTNNAGRGLSPNGHLHLQKAITIQCSPSVAPNAKATKSIC